MKNRKRKIDRKRLIYTFVFFVFCVFGLTVVYAALSTTLNISGSAEVSSSEWDVVFEKLDPSSIYGAKFELLCQEDGITCGDSYLAMGSASMDKLPTITNTTIKDFSISATLPGDMIILLYGVTNNGTIPAKLDSSDFSSDGLSGDMYWFDNNSVFGFSLKKDLNLSSDNLSVGDVICPGETKPVVVIFGISENATTVPSAPIVYSNMTMEYTFAQADLNSCLS